MANVERLQRYVQAEIAFARFTEGRMLHLLESNSREMYQRAFDAAERDRDYALQQVDEDLNQYDED